MKDVSFIDVNYFIQLRRGSLTTEALSLNHTYILPDFLLTSPPMTAQFD